VNGRPRLHDRTAHDRQPRHRRHGGAHPRGRPRRVGTVESSRRSGSVLEEATAERSARRPLLGKR
jgi:hypothetical protein